MTTWSPPRVSSQVITFALAPRTVSDLCALTDFICSATTTVWTIAHNISHSHSHSHSTPETPKHLRIAHPLLVPATGKQAHNQLERKRSAPKEGLLNTCTLIVGYNMLGFHDEKQLNSIHFQTTSDKELWNQALNPMHELLTRAPYPCSYSRSLFMFIQGDNASYVHLHVPCMPSRYVVRARHWVR